MKLQLDRPIVFFDLETTSADVSTARIIELAGVKMFPDMQTTEEFSYTVRPGIPIPPESTAVHGIKDADVADKPLFNFVGREIFEKFKGCHLGGFNSNKFDIPILFSHFASMGLFLDLSTTKFVDASSIFRIKEARTLTAAYAFYCGKNLDNAHNALADVKATVEVFKGQLEKYPDLPQSMDEMHLFCNYGRPIVDLSGKFSLDESKDIIFTFGKYSGRKIAEISKKDIGYLRYLLDQNFPEDSKQILRQYLK